MTEFVQRGAETIGRIDRDSSGKAHVYDKNGQYKGYADQHGTFDDKGLLVSDSQVPGILLRD